MNTEINPVNHPANRLGEMVFTKEGFGAIYKTKLGFFVWEHPVYDRGHLFPLLEAALLALGFRLGYDDEGFGKNKAGRCIEKHTNGEIWKVSEYQYFAWFHNTDASPEVKQSSSLGRARELLGIVIENKTPKTLPKSAYPQNAKGYSASK